MELEREIPKELYNLLHGWLGGIIKTLDTTTIDKVVDYLESQLFFLLKSKKIRCADVINRSLSLFTFDLGNYLLKSYENMQLNTDLQFLSCDREEQPHQIYNNTIRTLLGALVYLMVTKLIVKNPDIKEETKEALEKTKKYIFANYMKKVLIIQFLKDKEIVGNIITKAFDVYYEWEVEPNYNEALKLSEDLEQNEEIKKIVERLSKYRYIIGDGFYYSLMLLYISPILFRRIHVLALSGNTSEAEKALLEWYYHRPLTPYYVVIIQFFIFIGDYEKAYYYIEEAEKDMQSPVSQSWYFAALKIITLIMSSKIEEAWRELKKKTLSQWNIKITYKNREFGLYKEGEDWIVLFIKVNISPIHLSKIKYGGPQKLWMFMQQVMKICSLHEVSFDFNFENIYPTQYYLKYRIYEYGLPKQTIIKSLESIYEVDQEINQILNSIYGVA